VQWKPVNDYAIVSVCGSYSVAKYGGKPLMYGAWRMPAHPKGRGLLSFHRTAEAAKNACQGDADAPLQS